MPPFTSRIMAGWLSMQHALGSQVFTMLMNMTATQAGSYTDAWADGKMPISPLAPARKLSSLTFGTQCIIYSLPLSRSSSHSGSSWPVMLGINCCAEGPQSKEQGAPGGLDPVSMKATVVSVAVRELQVFQGLVVTRPLIVIILHDAAH